MVDKPASAPVGFAAKAESLVKRARVHGVELKPGEPFIFTIEKLIDRLDAYRDKPQNSGKIFIE